jgi:hypothetical protein
VLHGAPDFLCGFGGGLRPQKTGLPPQKRGQDIVFSDKKAGRGWHHHSRAPHRRSMGQGDNRLPE